MKRLIIIAFVIILLLGACGISETEEKQEEKPVHTFRGHKYGDTLEDVIAKEGIEPYEQSETEARLRIYDFYGYDGSIIFRFNDDGLKNITVVSLIDNTELNFQEVFDDLLPNLISEFGNPSAGIRENEDGCGTSWWKDGLFWDFYVDELVFILEINLEYYVPD
ncbi:MAG: hypothetical protein HN389_00975 [Clostridia bacterium]|jgi:hypothetical protein|nr:hypothetical protein [Clostridia bacterium]